jgi:hypothetical protein
MDAVAVSGQASGTGEVLARCSALLIGGTYLSESAVDLCAVVAVVVMVRVVVVVMALLDAGVVI